MAGESILINCTGAYVKGWPEFFFAKGKIVFLAFEVKRPLIKHLAVSFSEQMRIDPNSRVVRAVCQEFGYMVLSLSFRILDLNL